MGPFMFPIQSKFMFIFACISVGNQEVGKFYVGKSVEMKSDLFQVYISMSKNQSGLFIGPWIGILGAKSRLDLDTSFMLRPPWVHVARNLDGRPPNRSPVSPIVPRMARSMASWLYSCSMKSSIRSIICSVVVGLWEFTYFFSSLQK